MVPAAAIMIGHARMIGRCQAGGLDDTEGIEGQPQVRQPSRDEPEHGHAAPGQIRRPAHADRDDHRNQQARDPAAGGARSRPRRKRPRESGQYRR
jgi:hypothetical protein